MTEVTPRRRTGDVSPAAWQRLGMWFACALGLVLLRLALPFRTSDTMVVHQAIVDSLLQGHNWGRQALVGSLEYPLLPTLGLLAARTLVGVRFAGQWVVALAQIWALSYVVRLRVLVWRRTGFVIMLVVFCVALPDVRDAMLALDPSWLSAVPLCSAIYHLSRWFRGRELRDAVLTAINCGLLSFCGLTGVIGACGILLVLSQDVRSHGRSTGADIRGIPLLVWTPFVYCILLGLLWNWLVLGNLLFTSGQLWGALRRAPALGTLFHVLRAMTLGPACLWAFIGLAGVAAVNRPRHHTVALLGVAAAVVLGRSSCLAIGLMSGGGTLLVVCAALAVCAGVQTGEEDPCSAGSTRAKAAFAVSAIVFFLLDMFVLPVPNPVLESQFIVGAPAAETVTELVDQDWPRSRIAVHGVRLPTIYHDPMEARFVARMDFNEGMFLQQAQDEVMHILVPPMEGVYASIADSPLGDIHTAGRPYLLLEKQWSNGWQLWRCVVFPDDESRLKYLE